MPRDHHSQGDGEEQPWRFAGFALPTTTPVPDQLFDELMARLLPAELVVTLYIIRRTFGFKKPRDSISLRQLVEGIVTRDGRTLDHGTGLSKATVARALNSLEQSGVIIRDRNRSEGRGDEPTTYQLNFLYPVSHSETPPVSQFETPRVSPTRHPVSHQRDTQQTVRQQTVEDVSKDARTLDPTLQTDSLSKLRKGSRPGFSREKNAGQHQHLPADPAQILNGSRPPTPADIPAPASQAATVITSRDDRMLRISEVLAARGLSVHRATVPQERVAAPADASEPPPKTDASGEASAEYIDSVIEDISQKLGDMAHLGSNISQARHIWQTTGLPVQEFVDALYEVRRVVRFKAGIRNKMAYYFKCLRVALELEENPNPAPRYRRSADDDTPGQRKSLAGKYARYVRR